MQHNRWPALILITALGHLVIMGAAAMPGWRIHLWGSHAWTFLSPGWALAAAFLAASFGLLVWKARAFPTRFVPIAGISLCAAPVLFLLRDRTHLLGDGRLWIGLVSDDPVYHPNEPLAFLGASLATSGLRKAGPAALAGRLETWNLGLGVIALGLLMALAAQLGKEARSRWVSFSLMCSSGTFQFAFGYVEAYPLLWVSVLLYLLLALLALRGHATLEWMALALGLAVGVHATALALVPGFLLMLRGLAKTAGRAAGALLLAGGSIAAVYGLLPRTYPRWLEAETGLGALLDRAGKMLVEYKILSAGAGDWILNQLNSWSILAPSALGLIVLALCHRFRGSPEDRHDAIRTGDPGGDLDGALATKTPRFSSGTSARPSSSLEIQFLALTAASWALPVLVFDPNSWRGAAADWDVFALAGLPTTSLAAALWAPLAARSESIRRALVAVSSVGILSTGLFVALNANAESAARRFEALADSSGWTARGRAWAYETLAALTRDSGDLSEALRFYDKALGIQPRNTRLLRNKAGTLSWAGRHRESADAYLSAALTEPVFPRVWLNLGIELERAGSPDSAAAALRKALAQDSRSIEALNRLARLLLRESGTREEAYRLIEESLRLAPGQTNAPEMKAILVRAGRGEAAAGD